MAGIDRQQQQRDDIIKKQFREVLIFQTVGLDWAEQKRLHSSPSNHKLMD